MIKDNLDRTASVPVQVKHFDYCAVLNAENNIRALVQHIGENNLYVGITPLTITLFPDLYDNVNFKVNTLTPKTLIMVIGYRR